MNNIALALWTSFKAFVPPVAWWAESPDLPKWFCAWILRSLASVWHQLFLQWSTDHDPCNAFLCRRGLFLRKEKNNEGCKKTSRFRLRTTGGMNASTKIDLDSDRICALQLYWMSRIIFGSYRRCTKGDTANHCICPAHCCPHGCHLGQSSPYMHSIYFYLHMNVCRVSSMDATNESYGQRSK